jgi:hypothetical protein
MVVLGLNAWAVFTDLWCNPLRPSCLTIKCSSNQETAIATLRHLKYRYVSCRMELEEVVKLLVEREG